QPASAKAVAQARPRPLLDAQTMALRPRIPRSIACSSLWPERPLFFSSIALAGFDQIGQRLAAGKAAKVVQQLARQPLVMVEREPSRMRGQSHPRVAVEGMALGKRLRLGHIQRGAADLALVQGGS